MLTEFQECISPGEGSIGATRRSWAIELFLLKYVIMFLLVRYLLSKTLCPSRDASDELNSLNKGLRCWVWTRLDTELQGRFFTWFLHVQLVEVYWLNKQCNRQHLNIYMQKLEMYIHSSSIFCNLHTMVILRKNGHIFSLSCHQT